MGRITAPNRPLFGKPFYQGSLRFQPTVAGHKAEHGQEGADQEKSVNIPFGVWASALAIGLLLLLSFQQAYTASTVYYNAAGKVYKAETWKGKLITDTDGITRATNGSFTHRLRDKP